jgi:hypothetical protein
VIFNADHAARADALYESICEPVGFFRSIHRVAGVHGMFTPSKAVFVVFVVAAGSLGWRYVHRPKPAGHPPAAEALPLKRFDFRESGERLGLTFRHDPGHPTFFYPEIMGSGLAAADFNGDGRLDLLLRGSRPGKGHPYHKPGPTSALFLQKEDGTFEDATERSGLTDEGYAMGVAAGDVNNDGVPDVYLCNFGEDKLYVGRGDGSFVDATRSAGMANKGFASSACFVDFDRDGRLDLYVTNYVAHPKHLECKMVDGRMDYCSPRMFHGLPHQLFRNVTPAGAAPGAVRFEDVSERAGIARKPSRGLGVTHCDVNGDHWPDLFVANDVEPNFLWINQKDGTFLDAGATDGVAVNGAGEPQASMGVAETDADGDGKNDLVATNFRDEYTTVYSRRAYGFQDRSAALGVRLLTRPFTGFGLVAFDVDCDGADELIQVNGRVTQLPTEDALAPPTDLHANNEIWNFWRAYAERSQLLYRQGDRFEDARELAGDFGRWVGIGRGLACGDFDGDGRPDLAAIDFAERAKLFLNQAETDGHWISVRAVDDDKKGRDALGALVRVVAGDRRWERRVRTCGSYQSASEPRTFFGLGRTTQIDRVEIVWPDGETTPEAFPAMTLDHAYTLVRGQGAAKR